jgi:hypothetical protein
MKKAFLNEEKLVEILSRRKKLTENQIAILDRLRKGEKLTPTESWSVFELIRQEGPEVRFPYQESNVQTLEYFNN